MWQYTSPSRGVRVLGVLGLVGVLLGALGWGTPAQTWAQTRPGSGGSLPAVAPTRLPGPWTAPAGPGGHQPGSASASPDAVSAFYYNFGSASGAYTAIAGG